MISVTAFFAAWPDSDAQHMCNRKVTATTPGLKIENSGHFVSRRPRERRHLRQNMTIMSTHEPMNQPIHEPMKPSTHESSSIQIESMFAKAPCARRKGRQFKNLRPARRWRAMSPGYKKLLSKPKRPFERTQRRIASFPLLHGISPVAIRLASKDQILSAVACPWGVGMDGLRCRHWLWPVFAVALTTATVRAQPEALPPPNRSLPPGVVDLTPPILPSPAANVFAEPPPSPSQFALSAEYLLALPKRSDTDYAIADATNNRTPEGSIASVDWGASSGVRAGITYRPAGSLLDASVNYPFLWAGASQSLTAPTGGLLYATQTRPGLVDMVSTAQAASTMSYNVADIVVGRTIPVDGFFVFRWSGGVRIAAINETLDVMYDGMQATQTHVLRHSNFVGSGLTMATEGRWNLPNDFSLFGRAGGALLGGGQYASYLETDVAGATINANLTDQFWQVIPVLEMGVGIVWQRYGYQVSIGYEITNWFNLVTRTNLSDDLAEGKPTRKQGDLSIEGIYFRFTKSF